MSKLPRYYGSKTWKYSEDMSENQKDRFIRYLIDKVKGTDLDNRAMKLVLEDFKATLKNRSRYG